MFRAQAMFLNSQQILIMRRRPRRSKKSVGRLLQKHTRSSAAQQTPATAQLQVLTQTARQEKQMRAAAIHRLRQARILLQKYLQRVPAQASMLIRAQFQNRSRSQRMQATTKQ